MPNETVFYRAGIGLLVLSIYLNTHSIETFLAGNWAAPVGLFSLLLWCLFVLVNVARPFFHRIGDNSEGRIDDW